MRSGGLLLGWLLEREGPWFRVAIAAAGLCGLAGGWAFRRFSVRDEEELLEAERDRMREGARFDLAGIRHLLATDADFRHYMLAMSLFGAGFLTLTPLMVICLDDVLRASEFVQVAVTTAVPILIIPLAIQPWARFLDRHHVIVFRSVHSKVGAVASIAARARGAAAPAAAAVARGPAARRVAGRRAASAGRWATTISRRVARRRATWRCTSR